MTQTQERSRTFTWSDPAAAAAHPWAGAAAWN